MNLFKTLQQFSTKPIIRASFIVCTLLLALSHLSATGALAAQVSLSWIAPASYTDGTPVTSLVSYKVYTGTTPGSYSENIEVGNSTSYTLANLNDATTYYFAVTANDASGSVSEYSNQISYTTPAAPPPATIYSITATAGSGGSISPSGSIAITQGLSQSFTITPSGGYKIANVTVDGASVGAVSNYTFSNVTANHTISASFTASGAPYSLTASAGTGGTISPVGASSVNSGGSLTYTISAATGYKIGGVIVDGVSVGAVSTYTFSNVTANHTISASFSATAGQSIFAVNCGGSQFTSSSGIVYKADTYYSGGSTGTTVTAIAGTADDALYQTRRIGDFSYKIPVPNGNYSVTLKSAETYYSTAGQRVFDVKMEGVVVISNLDVFAKVGKNSAYDVTIPVSVSDGVLNIDIVSKKGSAMLQGINIVTR